MNKMVNKLLASMLVITLTFANLILLGTYATESLAAATELERQETLIKGKVDFDAYFLNEKGEKTHTKTIDINSQDEKLYVSIEVLQGYLRNAKIELLNSNFEMQNIADNYDAIQEISADTIIFNQIESGNKNVFEIPIKVNTPDKINLDVFTEQSEIKITGSAIDNRARTTTIENTIMTNLNLHGQANPVIEQEISKFTPYNVGAKAGFMLQTILKSGIENHTLPIEQTNIQVQVPMLKDGTKPTKINVTANSLEATRNDIEGISFTSENWNYDEEKGIVSISVNNEKDDQNMVNWGKEGLDEFVITYIFQDDAIPTELPVQLNAVFNIKLYNNEITEINKTEAKEVILQEKLGDIVTFEVETMQETLGKGFLYANRNYETEYQVKWIADLGYVDLVDQITMNQNHDTFLTQNGDQYATTVGENNYTYYKSTTISKDNFTKILGSDENAYINIYDKTTNTLISSINKDTMADENGNIVINYNTETNNLYIQTSKPIKEGKLEILHTKAIKAKTDYSIDQLKMFSGLKTNLIGAILNEDIKIVEIEKTKEIGLTEPTTKVEALVNNTKDVNLSTVVENKDVEFKVLLKNTDITSNLFKNPVVELVFPNYIQKMEITNMGLLFDEELAIDQNNIQTYKTEDGRLGMKIPVVGEQTMYNFNQTQNGTNIVIDANITAKQLTPSVNSAIEAYVTNENATSYEQEKDGKAYQVLGANFVAPAGMVTVNSIENYNLENETATSITGKEEVGELPIQSAAKTATMRLTIIDNYDALCKNVKILGRFPVKGNQAIVSDEQLGSTFTATLKSGITTIAGIDASNVTVYYTQNENATNDLNNAENGWTTDLQKLQEPKSYLIVLSNYEMQKGQTLEFAYDIEIPENLNHNEATYGTYVVYFDNVTEEQTIQDRSVAPKVGVSTKEGPVLEVSMYADVEKGANVQEGQIIEYTIAVENIGETEAKNIKVTSPVPEESVYVEYVPADADGYGPAYYKQIPEMKVVEKTISTIAAGRMATISYKVQVKSLNGQENKVVSTYATIEDYKTETIQNPIVKGYLKLNLKADRTKASENEKMSYEINIANANEEEKTNVTVELPIPNGMRYDSESDLNGQIIYNENTDSTIHDGEELIENNSQVNVTYDEQKNALICKIDSLKENNEVIWTPIMITDKITDEEIEKEIKQTLTATCDQTTEVLNSNQISFKIVKPKLEVKQESDIAPGEISVGDIITYHIEVKNTGKGTAYNTKVTDYIPEGLRYLQTTYTIGEKTNTISSGNTTATVTIDIPEQQTLDINIKGQVKELKDAETSKQIINEVKVVADNVEEIEANKVTHIVNSNGSGSGTGNGNGSGNSENRYKITGTVWEDTNQDGKRDDNERILSNIETILINSNIGTTVEKVTTDSSGKYSFTNLEQGRYMVVFLYDNVNYGVTDYQKNGVNDSRNSDAIQKDVMIDNTTITGAVTDIINISGSNIYNIDLGLIAKNKFDLSLTKKISHITVKTSKGTKNYDYNEGTTLAKVDIAPKRIEGANVIVEYKLTIKNEGTLEGYVNKIADYLPSEFKFNSSMNKDWYQAENGVLFNSSLADTIIKPGESKEVTLTLTKSMTGENTGVISNTAEIYEAYNNLGLADINSTPANKAQGENDMGMADVLITVNTGGSMLYVIITIVCLAILGVGFYMINKKVLRKTM